MVNSSSSSMDPRSLWQGFSVGEFDANSTTPGIEAQVRKANGYHQLSVGLVITPVRDTRT